MLELAKGGRSFERGTPEPDRLTNCSHRERLAPEMA
jgi:hypothetical protein